MRMRTSDLWSAVSSVSETIACFNYDLPSTAAILQRAVDAYIHVFLDTLYMRSSTPDVLQRLGRQYRLGLITNFAYPPGAYQLLDRYRLAAYFDTIVVSGEVGWKKPANQIFATALSNLSIEPKDAVYVGDEYEADMVGAKNAGMHTVYLSCEPDARDTIDVTIRLLTELPLALTTLGPRPFSVRNSHH